MGTHVCLPSCVTFASTHEVGVELLFCLVFGDRGRVCARRGGGGRVHVIAPFVLSGKKPFQRR